jgi:4-oxalocrotonate tautomerase
MIVRYVAAQAKENLVERIADFVARTSSRFLGKDPNVTAVLVEPAAPQNWFVGGKRPAEAGLSAFWLDIKITAGTNVKAETTAFIREIFAGMEDLLGPLHEESYVLVHAVDGDAYGYGGRTQNVRWFSAQRSA